MGTPQDTSPVFKKFWDQGARPGVNAAPQVGRRGPILRSLLRLRCGFPSHLTGGKSRRSERNGPASSHTSISIGTDRGSDKEGWTARTLRRCSVPSVPASVKQKRSRGGPNVQGTSPRSGDEAPGAPVPRNIWGGGPRWGAPALRAPPRPLPPLAAAALLPRLSLPPACPPSPARSLPRPPEPERSRSRSQSAGSAERAAGRQRCPAARRPC